MLVIRRLFIPFVFILLAASAARAANPYCHDSVLKVIENNQVAAFEGFEQEMFRGLSEYYTMSSPSFARALVAGMKKPDFRWLDAGGGAGMAAIESLYPANPANLALRLAALVKLSDEQLVAALVGSLSKKGVFNGLQKFIKPTALHSVTVVSAEDVLGGILARSDAALVGMLKSRIVKKRYIKDFERKLKSLRLMAKQAGELKRFKYLHGRKLRDIPSAELGAHDLVSDIYGPFSYDPCKLCVLQYYCKVLKPGGEAHIVTNQAHVMMPGGGMLTMTEFLKQSGIPGLRITSDVRRIGIELKPTPETLAALERLEKRLVLESGMTKTKTKPPVFYYLLK